MISFSEKDLEEFIIEHLDLIDPQIELIGRQVKVPGGVIDILGVDRYELVVIELKTSTLDDSAFGQIVRYRFALDSVFEKFVSETHLAKWWAEKGLDFPESGLKEMIGLKAPASWTIPTRMILIGPGIKNNCIGAVLNGPFEVHLYQVSLEKGLTLTKLENQLWIQCTEEENPWDKFLCPSPVWKNLKVVPRWMKDRAVKMAGELLENQTVVEEAKQLLQKGTIYDHPGTHP